MGISLSCGCGDSSSKEVKAIKAGVILGLTDWWLEFTNRPLRTTVVGTAAYYAMMKLTCNCKSAGTLNLGRGRTDKETRNLTIRERQMDHNAVISQTALDDALIPRGSIGFGWGLATS